MRLREQVLRGGTYLILRQGLGVVIGAAGILVLTRIIGPAAYGEYATAFALSAYLASVSQLGLGVWLIRHPGELPSSHCDTAFSLLLVLSAAGIALGLLSILLLRPWLPVENFGLLAAALVAGLPVQLAAVVPMARFERALDYGRVARIEIGGRAACYLAALPLAGAGFGAWAAVAGWWSEQLVVLAAVYWASGFRPRWLWDRALAREMVGYGLGYSGATWIRQLGNLINPLLLGRFLGAEGVGYAALAIRIVESLSFAAIATLRLSLSALARVQQDRARLTQAITEGTRLQLAALGAPLVGFAWASPWLLPWLFGDRWTPVLEIYPFIALYYLTHAMFNLHLSVLSVLKHNREVAVINATNVALVAAGVGVLVWKFGLAGYGWGLALGLLSCAVARHYVVKLVGRPDYGLAILWWAAAALAVFAAELGPWTALGLVAALLWPGTRRELRKYAGEFRQLRGGVNPSPGM